MSLTSAGHILQKRPFPIVFSTLFIYFVFALFCHCSFGLHTQRLSARFSILPSAQPIEMAQSQRHRRATTESLLTVEWEGNQSGDHPDSSIRGFIVEYRAEKESQWYVHSGVIPYKGSSHQYQVKIPKFPTGISYFVRIKVLGEKGKVMEETPEIRARNEVVSVKCELDEITAPGDVEVKKRGQFSVALTWQPPECGSIGEYQIELWGIGPQQFDVYRQTVAQPQASITGLLSDTEYAIRIRAVDRSSIVGPWIEKFIIISTKDDLPEEAQAKLEYSTDSEARVSWPLLDDGRRLQHYGVIKTKMDGPNEEHVEL